MKPRVLVITGPTAAGKSALALELAERLDGELVCADSLTVYCGLDIGSAKPSLAERQRIPHHLLDIREPTQPFSAADFREAAMAAIAGIIGRGRRPILVGGTGLYLRTLLRGLIETPGEDPALREQLRQQAEQEGSTALLEALRAVDPQTAGQLHANNLPRIVRALEVFHHTGRPLSALQAEHGFGDSPYRTLQFCLELSREALYDRIEARVDAMLRAGLVAEVAGLLQRGIPPDCKPLQAIGYKEVVAYLQGSYGIDEMAELIKRNTRRFAKRQLTWFKKEPELQWVAYPENSASILATAETFFA